MVPCHRTIVITLNLILQIPQIGQDGEPTLTQTTNMMLNSVDFNNMSMGDLNRQVYKKNWGAIKTHSHHHRNMSVFNFMIENGDLVGLLRSGRLNTIMQQVSSKFKLQASLGFTLYSQDMDQLKFWHPSQNNQKLFTSPVLIENQQQFDECIESMSGEDFIEKAASHRPNTQWVVSSITNICFYAYKITNHPIGSSVELPVFLKKNRAMKCLDANRSGDRYEDKLCLWRCLALHRGKSTTLESTAKQLFAEYQEHCGEDTAIGDFKGLTIDELGEFEDVFKTAIVVYCLNTNGEATLVRRSAKTHCSTMYLNVYKQHFSYIVNIDLFTKSYRCSLCSKLWKSAKALGRHFPCSNSTTYEFKGGMYEASKGLFESLEEEGLNVPENLKYHNFRACYDCEVFFSKDNLPESTKSTSWTARHELASVSVCSNVPGYQQARCFISTGDEYLLVSEMMTYLDVIQVEAFKLQREKFHHILRELDAMIEYQIWQEDKAMIDAGLHCLDDYTFTSPLDRLRSRLETHLQLLPVFGFNSGR